MQRSENLSPTLPLMSDDAAAASAAASEDDVAPPKRLFSGETGDVWQEGFDPARATELLKLLKRHGAELWCERSAAAADFCEFVLVSGPAVASSADFRRWRAASGGKGVLAKWEVWLTDSIAAGEKLKGDDYKIDVADDDDDGRLPPAAELLFGPARAPEPPAARRARPGCGGRRKGAATIRLD